MNIEDLRKYTLSKPGVEESFPFGVETLVFKVNGKIFLLVGLDRLPLQFNAKCDPERAIELRDQYSCIVPGYHMNKKHWNTVYVNSGSIPGRDIRWMIDHSYEQVVKGLTNKLKNELNLL